MSERTIYLDHAATTALDARVLDVMLPYFTTEYGNASSISTLGRHAMQALDSAREQVADILGCRPTEISFMGCGSESDNLAIKGIAFASQKKGNHFINTPIEHHAVLHTCPLTLMGVSILMTLAVQLPIRPSSSRLCMPTTRLELLNLWPRLAASAVPERYPSISMPCRLAALCRSMSLPSMLTCSRCPPISFMGLKV